MATKFEHDIPQSSHLFNSPGDFLKEPKSNDDQRNVDWRTGRRVDKQVLVVNVVNVVNVVVVGLGIETGIEWLSFKSGFDGISL